MNILVIGKNGQVARALQERAQERAKVTVLGRPEFDLAHPGALPKAEVVINAAAYTAVDKAESEEALATQINGAGAGAVAAAAQKVIHLSTDYVFDGALNRPYREDDPTNPLSAYGRSKLAGEIAVRAANPRHVILRTSWVYSPFGTNFVRTMLRLGAERSEVRVVADQFGAPTSAHDIADAILKIAQGGPYGTFHLTGSGEATWAEFAQAVFAQAGLKTRVTPIPTHDYPTPARRPANSRLDGAKLRAAYGITLPPWRESLKPVVARLLNEA